VGAPNVAGVAKGERVMGRGVGNRI